jgi:predicted AlkP superfamily phosphohydrolase/phosphomutase
MTSRPVWLIGLDAADLSRIERLAACGDMPYLAEILGRGARGRVSSVPTGLSAMIWPKWFEGGHTGSRYFSKQWNPDRMCLERITATRGDPEPFWCDLDRRGLKVCVVDVPQAPKLPLRHGVAIQGWQVHDLFDRWSEPSGLWKELTRDHGAPLLGPESYGRQTPASLLALRRQLLAATRQAGELVRGLMRRGPFDVFVMILGGLHRGGHYLWDTSQVELRGANRDEVRLLETALDEIYKAADRAVGQLIEHAPAGARVLVFSLHGMESNNGWSERLQSFAGMLSDAGNRSARATLLQSLRRRVPTGAMQRALDFLPERLGNRVLEFTSARMYDWQQTAWFVLPSDLAGFLRLNLLGREARGIVSSGEQANSVEDMLIETFSRIEDLDGRSIVATIERVNDLVAGADRFRRYLPDLLLNWHPIKASDTAGLRLNGQEIARWPAGEPFDSGRSGNHATEGWFVAFGPGLSRRTDPALHDINAIVPSVYRWLGLEPPGRFVGKPLFSLIPSL